MRLQRGTLRCIGRLIRLLLLLLGVVRIGPIRVVATMTIWIALILLLLGLRLLLLLLRIGTWATRSGRLLGLLGPLLLPLLGLLLLV